jgi:nucleoside-diphosphate-sugar epimerase
MTTALIGHSGFVGGCLRAQTAFDDLYRRADVDTIRGKAYDLVVCAGAPAAKWIANAKPEEDLAGIRRLMDALGGVRARHVVLISTVDVYPNPVEVDEESPIDPAAGSPYGRHRYALERFVAGRFDATIVRLPGLFGDGLKKNVIYDFLHNNGIDRINPAGVFQFYSLDHLWADLRRIRALGLPLVNVATEPTSVREIAREGFGFEFENAAPLPALRYDFRSRHAAKLGGRGGYLYDRGQVLADLRRFLERSGWRKP